MKALKFQETLSRYIEHGHANDEVVIHCKENGMGASAAESIEDVYAGFDWDDGRILIEPEKPLMHYEKERDTPVPAIKIHYRNDYGGKIKPTLHCPTCDCRLYKDMRYCPKCGRRVDTENVRDVTL